METLSALALMAGTAFLSATILAAQSEAVFVALLAKSGVDPLLLFAVATVANTAGSVVTWWMGLLAVTHENKLPPRFRPDPARMARGRERFLRFGGWSLLFAWLPIVGEFFVLAAGALRYPLFRFCILVGIGKAFRYGLLWAGFRTVTS